MRQKPQEVIDEAPAEEASTVDGARAKEGRAKETSVRGGSALRAADRRPRKAGAGSRTKRARVEGGSGEQEG